jgi:hypothetical protein
MERGKRVSVLIKEKEEALSKVNSDIETLIEDIDHTPRYSDNIEVRKKMLSDLKRLRDRRAELESLIEEIKR